MKRDNGDLNLFKFVGIGAVVFCLFIIIGSRFVTVDNDSKEETKIAQTDSIVKEESKLKAELRDAEILGKFWNSKGYFIIIYNDLTKAPEVLEVEKNEWGYMKVGELY